MIRLPRHVSRVARTDLGAAHVDALSSRPYRPAKWLASHAKDLKRMAKVIQVFALSSQILVYSTQFKCPSGIESGLSSFTSMPMFAPSCSWVETVLRIRRRESNKYSCSRRTYLQVQGFNWRFRLEDQKILH